MAIRIIAATEEVALARLRQRLQAEPRARLEGARRRVKPIVAAVRRDGDDGLARWARRLDGARFTDAAPLRVPQEELARAWKRLPAPLRQALRRAGRNIERMARWQKPRSWMRTMEPGVRVGQSVVAIASVGCYIPAGRHPLPSSVLMTALVARAAGVPRIVAVCPHPTSEVLAAAHLAGVSELYRVGGAQAIAALAYGTRSLPRVEKIVGPGNLYVTAAKQLVADDCAIDFAAGPTEVLVVAEAKARAEWVAADLLAQAEHDTEAAAWLVTPSRRLARAVDVALERQLRAHPNPVAAAALSARGVAVVTASLAAAVALANELAPEHLTVPAEHLAGVTAAGSIFVGDYAPQAVGDYAAGPNHVLPTGGGARVRGGLAAADFCKVITVQQLTRSGLRRLAPTVTALATVEGLPGHAASARKRLEP